MEGLLLLGKNGVVGTGFVFLPQTTEKSGTIYKTRFSRRETPVLSDGKQTRLPQLPTLREFSGDGREFKEIK